MQHFMILLFECSLSMTVLGILLMSASTFLQKKFTAKARYYTWITMILGLIIPLRFQLPNLNLPTLTILPGLEYIDRATNLMIYSSIGTSTSVAWYEAVFALWISGITVFTIYHINQHRLLLRMVERWSVEYSNLEGLELLKNVQESMRISRHVQLRICPGIPCPMLIGFVRPVILLPSVNISDQELLFILKHELIHFKRGDLVLKMLVFAATAIHWFNPLVYRMAREINLQCEISCDEEVIKQATIQVRQQYVETLINIMKKQSNAQSVFITSFSDRRLSMKKRIHSIMDSRRKQKGFALLTIIVLFMFILGAALQGSLTQTHSLTEANNWPDSLVYNVEPEEEGSLLQTQTHESNVSNSDEPKQSDNKEPIMFASPGISYR
ncbi:M56 family metallopeptidase [Paenibacillus pini]|uniref:Peptidase M56 domain-containing protein n=1 Tax=Paenibacillus pini JCM 16418 TaxID=1236976 RepID=W7YL96_9BACL|nr:M56 family metallopeptidase [Paenibacillus pini]GAF09317.1 hypothetical protein JCM16418_3454 [Paenibacillus pini JCM 16418]